MIALAEPMFGRFGPEGEGLLLSSDGVSGTNRHYG